MAKGKKVAYRKRRGVDELHTGPSGTRRFDELNKE